MTGLGRFVVRPGPVRSTRSGLTGQHRQEKTVGVDKDGTCGIGQPTGDEVLAARDAHQGDLEGEFLIDRRDLPVVEMQIGGPQPAVGMDAVYDTTHGIVEQEPLGTPVRRPAPSQKKPTERDPTVVGPLGAPVDHLGRHHDCAFARQIRTPRRPLIGFVPMESFEQCAQALNLSAERVNGGRAHTGGGHHPVLEHPKGRGQLRVRATPQRLADVRRCCSEGVDHLLRRPDFSFPVTQ
jgi:hypothetical protein